MIHRLRNLPAQAILGVFVAACVLAGPSHAGETWKLTRKDHDRHEPLKIKPDDHVHVVLGFQPGTGFRWKLAADSTSLLELEKPKEGEKVDESGNPLSGNPPSGRPGQTEYRRFKLHVSKDHVAKEGQRDLKLILTRSGSDRPARTFKVPIEVD